jgi:hypothetical protein
MRAMKMTYANGKLRTQFQKRSLKFWQTHDISIDSGIFHVIGLVCYKQNKFQSDQNVCSWGEHMTRGHVSGSARRVSVHCANAPPPEKKG